MWAILLMLSSISAAICWNELIVDFAAVEPILHG